MILMHRSLFSQILQARIPRLQRARDGVLAPLIAGRFDTAEVHNLGDVGEALEELDRQTGSDMPGDVAVEQPDTRVVGLVGEDQVTITRQHGNIAADRVLRVETSSRAIPST